MMKLMKVADILTVRTVLLSVHECQIADLQPSQIYYETYVN